MSGCKTFPNAVDTGELQFQGKELHRLLINAQKAGWHSKQLGDGGVFTEISQTLLHSHTPAHQRQNWIKRPQTDGTWASQGYFLKATRENTVG